MDYTNFMIAVFFMVLSNVIIVVSRTRQKKEWKIGLSIVAYVTLLFAVIFVFRAFFT